MSDILIKGMEMPKDGFVEILVREDGTVQQTGQSYRIDGTDYYTPYVGEMPVMYEAIPVPPHGDLINRDVLIEHMETEADNFKPQNLYDDGLLAGYNAAIRTIREFAPTVIPAELPVHHGTFAATSEQEALKKIIPAEESE